MTGSQKFALVMGAGGLLLIAMATLMYSYGPQVDARIAQKANQRNRDLSGMVAALERETNSRGLYYYIYCTAYYEGDPEKWRGMVTSGSAFNIYIEDGAAPYWNSGLEAFNSKEEVAEVLLLALKQPPNAQPQHKELRAMANCPAITNKANEK